LQSVFLFFDSERFCCHQQGLAKILHKNQLDKKMEIPASDDLSEEEFQERILKYQDDRGAIKGPECMKGFSSALFKRREKCVPHRRALQMLKSCRDEATLAMYHIFINDDLVSLIKERASQSTKLMHVLNNWLEYAISVLDKQYMITILYVRYKDIIPQFF
jgi:hypothetical protein